MTEHYQPNSPVELDWTRLELAPDHAREFTHRYLWPSIDTLRWQKGLEWGGEISPFSVFNVESGASSETLRVTLQDWQEQSRINDHRPRIDRNAILTVHELVKEPDSPPMKIDGHDVWRQTTYNFHPHLKDPYTIDSYPYLNCHSDGFSLDDYTDHQKAMLAGLKHQDGRTMTHQDCLEVGGALGYLGLPRRYGDDFLDRFWNILEP